MSLCGVCYSPINDGEPCDKEHLSYDGCESDNDNFYTNR